MFANVTVDNTAANPVAVSTDLTAIEAGSALLAVASSQEVLTASNSVDVSAKTTKGIYCVLSGTLVTTGTQTGAASISRAVSAGDYIQIRVKYVNVGTTAGLAEGRY